MKENKACRDIGKTRNHGCIQVDETPRQTDYADDGRQLCGKHENACNPQLNDFIGQIWQPEEYSRVDCIQRNLQGPVFRGMYLRKEIEFVPVESLDEDEVELEQYYDSYRAHYPVTGVPSGSGCQN